MKSGVRIRIVDHASRRELVVEPRNFKGRLIHGLPEVRCPFGETYLEFYFAEPSNENAIGLYKKGTRVIPDLSSLDRFAHAPWTTGRMEGLLDAPFLQLTPGTRDGIVLDEVYDSLCSALEPVEDALLVLLDEQRRAEEDETSRHILNKVTRALREAFLHLPSEDYGWLSAKTRDARSSGGKEVGPGAPPSAAGEDGSAEGNNAESGDRSGGELGDAGNTAGEDATFGEYIPEPLERADPQKSFFEYAGPLHKLMISPASSVIGIGERKKLRAVARDRSSRVIDSGLDYEWRIVEGTGGIEGTDSPFADYIAPDEPCVASIELHVRQGNVQLTANALVTVTAELIRRGSGGEAGSASRRGLPGYTYVKAPGELWRSRFDAEKTVIVINNAHADFIYASRQAMTKLRYITHLFAKELVLANFPEASKEELLERMIELSLYTDENLK